MSRASEAFSGPRAGGGTRGVKVTMAAKCFFNPETIAKAVDKANKGALSQFGAFVRRRAKSSLRAAPQLRLSQMKPRQRLAYAIRRDRAKRKGEPKPRRPEAISKPGQPPLLHNHRGPRARPASANPLKNLIFFAYDTARKSVVIGPLPFHSMGAEKLEHGTGGMQARPFMGPAMLKELPGLTALWRDGISTTWSR